MTEALERAIREGLRGATEARPAPVTEILQNVRGRAPRAHRAQRLRRGAASTVSAAAVLAAVAVLSHVGPSLSRPTPPVASTSAPTTITVDQACPAAIAATPEHEPANLGPVVAAYICSGEERTLPDGSTWQFTVAHRVTDGLDALLAAYAIPDAPPSLGFCAAVGTNFRPLFVQLSDRVLNLRPPSAGCEHTEPTSSVTLDDLTTVVAAERKDQLLRSALANSSGCSHIAKDVLVWARQAPSHGSFPAPLPDSGAILVCTYAGGSTESDGTLVAAHTLTTTQISSINRELSASVADSTCLPAVHTGFVLISDASYNNPVYVAVGGCAIQQGSVSWRASPGLLALVAAG